MPPTPTWLTLPHVNVEIRGLPWLDLNAPDLWRIPREAETRVPEGVLRQARFPAGARLRISANTSQLHLRVEGLSPTPGHGIDCYVNDSYWRSVRIAEGEQTVTFFEETGAGRKEITLYLPYRQEVRLQSVGIDRGASPETPQSFADDLPLVLYGSSLAQGAGAARSSMSYVAILARRRGVDFVNLGFGGAGKAEPDVVELVTQVPARCYLFDLGKSYGMQSADAYIAMLAAVRAAHPETPIACITPIFATRELYSAEYAERSRHTRDVPRLAFSERVEAGDSNLHLIEGLDLLGPNDADGFSSDGVHPNDLGHFLIAQRIEERMRGVASPK